MPSPSANSIAVGDEASSAWVQPPGKRYSPIPYRVGPLEHHPDVLCHCGRKAAMWISWSDENPGQRYFKCYRAREDGCSFHGWYEGPHDPFVQTLLIDLRNAVWRLKRENSTLSSAIADAAVKVEAEKKDVGEWKLEVATARAQKEEMAYKVQRMDYQNKVLRAMLVGALAVVMWLWAGKQINLPSIVVVMYL